METFFFSLRQGKILEKVTKEEEEEGKMIVIGFSVSDIKLRHRRQWLFAFLLQRKREIDRAV